MKTLFAYMGIDRAIVYTLAGRGWSLVSSIVTLLMVSGYLSPDEQGYYYTFASVVAMQILFELGMSVVVMQFASHEMASLSWTEGGILQGEVAAIGRLRSLILLVAKWYGVVAILIVVLILPVGWLFFSSTQAQSSVDWRIAWAALVCAAAANIFFAPFLALLEGCGRVTEIARLRMKQNMIASLWAWAVLISGGGLMALSAMSFGLFVTVLWWLWRTKKKFFSTLLSRNGSTNTLNWKAEIWPFQWRIAVSWLSGYFIFQLFTPVLFAYEGPVAAGQMGMSISIANALMAVAIAWINTKSPRFGSLVAAQDYKNLDSIFFMTLSRSLAVMTIGGIGLCAVNYILHIELMAFSNRILDPLPFSLLVVATIFTYITYAESTYLRAHKEEPFMLISVISAGLIGSLTVILAKKYGAVGLMGVYAIVYGIVGVGCGSAIFLTKRRDWQQHCIHKVR